MNAAVITIGDEILLGQITDTNSQFIAAQLAKWGIEVVKMYSVADKPEEIRRVVEEAFACAPLVLVTGGLGPTKDDLTKKTLADYFGTELVFRPEAYAWVEELLKASHLPMNAYNKSQAVLPKDCTLLRNLKGTASGMWFEKEGRTLISLPGVPFETEYLMTAEVLPRLKEKYAAGLLAYRMCKVYGISESELAMRLDGFERALPKGMGLAYLPSESLVKLRLTAHGGAVEKLDEFDARLQKELSGLQVTRGEESSLPEQVAARLTREGKTLACAESCTGGNIAHTVTARAGASAYFLGGVVAYANDVKRQVLGVRAEDLEAFGAVSKPVALQMAEGIRRITGADWAVSTTGIAGPDGGTPQKPVGTVWIAVAGPNGAHAKEFHFSRTRERNIGKATSAAFKMLWDALATLEK